MMEDSRDWVAQLILGGFLPAAAAEWGVPEEAFMGPK